MRHHRHAGLVPSVFALIHGSVTNHENNKGIFVFTGSVMLLIGVIIYRGAGSRVNAEADLTTEADAAAIPSVTLETQVDAANQTLNGAEENYRAARAAIMFNRQQLKPTIGTGTEAACYPTVNLSALAGAQQSLDLSQTRYEGGVDTYLQVVTRQRARGDRSDAAASGCERAVDQSPWWGMGFRALNGS